MTTAVKSGQGKAAAPVATRAFRIGVQRVDETGTYDESRPMTTSSQDLPTLSVPATGFLNGLYVWVTVTTAGNSATTAFQADGPWSAIDTIEFDDVNTKPIIGPFGGWDVYCLNKFGGYAFQDDPSSSPTYAATTGSGGTGGSAGFCLFLPLELCPRDGLGSLPNKASNSTFKLKIRLAPSTAVYSTAPTTLGTVRVRVLPKSYWDPDAADMKGRPLSQQPPAVTTTQFWSKTDLVVPAGAISPMLPRVGFLLRNLVFVLRDNAGSRTVGEADFPDPFMLQYEANIMINRYRDVWRHQIARDYGYSGAVANAAGAKDLGVYVENYCHDFGSRPGWESRRGYLPTSSTSRLQVKGTVGGTGNHTLTVLTNDVSPAAGDDAAITV